MNYHYKLINSFKLFKLVILILFVLLITGCKNDPKEQITDITGVYKLLTTDTISEDISGLKILSEDYYIFAQQNNSDSVSTFEFGTYEFTDNQLSLKSLYSSSGTKEINQKSSLFQVDKNEKGIIEIFSYPNNQESTITTKLNHYKYIGSGDISKSTIDGAWKLIENYTIENNDTIWEPSINYKIVYDGYYIWGAFHHFKGVTDKHHTYIGAGTSAMNGKNYLEETVLITSWPSIIGVTFPIDVKFRNDNVFKQTIEDTSTGIKYIEVYERLGHTK